jgi:hypothetical protein
VALDCRIWRHQVRSGIGEAHGARRSSTIARVETSTGVAKLTFAMCLPSTRRDNPRCRQNTSTEVPPRGAATRVPASRHVTGQSCDVLGVAPRRCRPFFGQSSHAGTPRDGADRHVVTAACPRSNRSAPRWRCAGDCDRTQRWTQHLPERVSEPRDDRRLGSSTGRISASA